MLRRLRQLWWLLPCTALLVSSCANPEYMTPLPPTDPLVSQRLWYLLVAIGAMVLQGGCLIAFWVDSPKLINSVTSSWPSVVAIALLWTKLGEWGYLLVSFVFNQFSPLAIGIFFLSGLLGGTGGLVLFIVQFGYVFPSPDIFFTITRWFGIGLGIHLAFLLGVGLWRKVTGISGAT